MPRVSLVQKVSFASFLMPGEAFVLNGGRNKKAIAAITKMRGKCEECLRLEYLPPTATRARYPERPRTARKLSLKEFRSAPGCPFRRDKIRTWSFTRFSYEFKYEEISLHLAACFMLAMVHHCALQKAWCQIFHPSWSNRQILFEVGKLALTPWDKVVYHLMVPRR